MSTATSIVSSAAHGNFAHRTQTRATAFGPTHTGNIASGFHATSAQRHAPPPLKTPSVRKKTRNKLHIKQTLRKLAGGVVRGRTSQRTRWIEKQMQTMYVAMPRAGTLSVSKPSHTETRTHTFCWMRSKLPRTFGREVERERLEPCSSTRK